MSGDLMFRMVYVAAKEPGQQLWKPDHELWRQGAAMSSVPIEFSAHDAPSAAAALSRGGVDICVMDAGLPHDEKAVVMKAAQEAQPSPFTIEAAARGTHNGEGVALQQPANAADARKLVDACVRAKIPNRVLIVDDSSTMRGIVRKILTASRFSLDVHEASEGEAAIEQLRTGNFGMVFLDYNMPGLNGFETLAMIKRDHPTMAVVMITSVVDNAIADRAHMAGATAFLKKPFYPTEIDEVLARQYGLHAATD
jgi:DNA-binding NarL/FixJ family response regulator